MISPSSLLLILPFISLALAQATPNGTVQYTIYNLCPASIKLYNNGVLDSTLAVNASVVRTIAGAAGPFYTDANGGSASGVGSTKAEFDPADGYYYIVKDPKNFNTGMNVFPLAASRLGLCVGAECTDSSCVDAYTTAPTSFPPPVSNVAPAPPLYICQGNQLMNIVFCPFSQFPPPPVKSTVINPNGNTAKCLDVRGDTLANGTPVQIYDCNGTPAQQWVLNSGSTKVQLANTNFCLDAGSNPANGVGMKIWQCYDGLPAQQWYLTGDNRIAVQGAGQCLDLTNGDLTNSNQLQTWQCTNFNTNQVWTL